MYNINLVITLTAGMLVLPGSLGNKFAISGGFASVTLPSNESAFPSVSIHANGLLSRCWAANSIGSSSSVLEIYPFDCNVDMAVVCRKFLPTPNLCNQSNPAKPAQLKNYRPLDLLLDPDRKVEFKKAVAQKRKEFKDIFKNLDLISSFR
jgi:hypothetical protein